MTSPAVRRGLLPPETDGKRPPFCIRHEAGATVLERFRQPIPGWRGASHLTEELLNTVGMPKFGFYFVRYTYLVWRVLHSMR